MSFLKRLQERNKEVKTFSSEYFEMTYLKFGDKLTLVFTAPDLERARVKAKYTLRNFGGEKVLDVRKLDIKNLGPSITWYRSGEIQTKYTKKRKK